MKYCTDVQYRTYYREIISTVIVNTLSLSNQRSVYVIISRSQPQPQHLLSLLVYVIQFKYDACSIGQYQLRNQIQHSNVT